MEEWEKQLDELRVQNKIARAALFDNIQALDARVAFLETQLERVKGLFELQLKINKDLNQLVVEADRRKGKYDG